MRSRLQFGRSRILTPVVTGVCGCHPLVLFAIKERTYIEEQTHGLTCRRDIDCPIYAKATGVDLDILWVGGGGGGGGEVGVQPTSFKS